ncbi:MAG: class I SAM-dependent methyltransferase [Candidatus Omnitrophota bacterium]
MEFKYVDCNLCGENNFDILQNSDPYKLVKCKKCGLIYINPQPEESSLAANYDQGYFTPWLTKQISVRRKMWKRRLKKIQPFKNTGRLLDVGCGTGQFLNEAKNNGWRVWGTEVSEYALNYAKDEFCIEVFKGKLENANFPENFFDVVTFWHVLEHTTDPLGNLIEARRILRRSGIMVIAVPNVKNYIYKIAYMIVKLRRPRIFTSLNDREIHLYHFSTDTLKKMLEKAGLIPIKFDIDKERAFLWERILDISAWALYKILKVNFGIAFEVYAKKIK